MSRRLEKLEEEKRRASAKLSNIDRRLKATENASHSHPEEETSIDSLLKNVTARFEAQTSRLDRCWRDIDNVKEQTINNSMALKGIDSKQGRAASAENLNAAVDR